MTDDATDIDDVPDEILRDALQQTTTLQSDGRECQSCGAHGSVYAYIGPLDSGSSYEFCLACGRHYEVAFPPEELIQDYARELNVEDLEHLDDDPEATIEDISVLAGLRDRLRDALGDDDEWIILHRTELESDSGGDGKPDTSTGRGEADVDESREQQDSPPQSKTNSTDDEQVTISRSILATLADFPYGKLRYGFHAEDDELYEAVIEAYELLPDEDFDPPLDQRIEVLSELDTAEKRHRLTLERFGPPFNDVDEENYSISEDYWQEFLERHREIHGEDRESNQNDDQ